MKKFYCGKCGKWYTKWYLRDLHQVGCPGKGK